MTGFQVDVLQLASLWPETGMGGWPRLGTLC